MAKILKCSKCKRYTMRERCPRCKIKTVDPRPPKFSPQDRYGKERRKMKKEMELKEW